MGQQCSFAKNTVYSPPGSPSGGSLRKAKAAEASYNYSREQTTLRELFAAIRTGLVVSEAEFGVLPPGIATSAKIKFGLCSNSADADATATKNNQRAVGPEAKMTENDAEHSESSEEGEEGDQKHKQSHVLETTLNGPGWAQGLRMHLSVRPIVGPFANRRLMLSWSKNTLRVEGSEMGELNPRTIPDSFENETDFCKCCLLLAYHTDPSGSFNPTSEEGTEKEDVMTSGEALVVPLKLAAYQTLIANLDAIPQNASLPTRFYHLLYGSQGPVDVAIRAWPSTHATLFGSNPRMRVKSGILFAEFFCVLRTRFHLPPTYSVKLYHNHMPVQYSDLVSAKYQTIDCFAVQRGSGSDSLYGSYCSGLDMATDSDTTLVVSLVGYSTQNITADLDMKLSDFDRLLRKSFSFKEDSFLLVSAEDDYTPQYSSYDNWKCVYSFALPDTSFRAGLRRSFRRLSFSRRRSVSGDRARQLPQDQINEALAPHLDRVIEFLSSSSRHFPSNLDKSGFSMEQLYQTMPMFQLSLDECHIHPYTVTQVFEVTGPAIPVTFRVVSSMDRDPSTTGVGKQHDATTTAAQLSNTRTRLTNVMDINPDWPLRTFLRYVDAIVSPGATVRRRRRLAMGERSLEDWEERPELTLGQLLTQWGPAWWPDEGGERKTLTIKDIDPSEFLVIEKL